MATSSAVVAGEEQSARFHHLLRPIRDLADSWNIDLASDLATYVDELSAIQISLDGGSTTVNFAEAALLIQGSACVYSKKVEYLYSLVYQTLNRVSEKERAPLQTATVDARGVDLDAPTPRLHEVDFLTLDFLQEGANLLLSEEDALGLDNEAITSKTPMHVLASGELGAGSGALHMRGASMHASGVLMLDNWEGADPASARMLDTMLVGMASASGARPTCTAGAPALGAPVGVGPSPAIAGQLALTFDAAVGADSADAEREDEYDDDDGGDFGGAPDFADDMDDGREAREGGVPVAGGGRDGAPPAAVGAFTVAIADGQPVLTAPAACAPLGGGTAPLGPWTPLDPNDASGAADPRPFRKGRTWKLPPKSAGALEPLRAGAKRDTHGRPVHVAAGGSVCGAPAEPCAPAGSSAPDSPDGGDACALRSRVALLAADLLAPSGLAAGAWSIKGQPGLHAHFGPKMEAESRRRAAVRKAARDALATHAHVPPAAEAEADADLDVDADADLAADGAFLALADGAHDAHGEGDDADAELDGLDGGAAFGDDDDDDDSGGGAVDFAPSAREDPVTDAAPPSRPRSVGARERDLTLSGYHLRLLNDEMERAHEDDGSLALHARVSAWEARLLPLLEAQERRRQFDIAHYTSRLLAQLPDAPRADASACAARPVPSEGGCARAMPFATLMAGAERFEVCRMFLAALQLANNRNVDIVVPADGCANGLGLQLLTREPVFAP